MRGPLSGMVTTSVGAVRVRDASGRAARSRARGRARRRAAPRAGRRRRRAPPAPAARWSRGCRRRTRRRRPCRASGSGWAARRSPAAASASRVGVGRARDAEAGEHGPRDGGVARVVRPGQPERRATRRCPVPTSAPLTQRSVRPEARGLRAELAVGAVGEGQRDPGLGAQRELVGVVALDRAVPVEMVGGQRGDRDHPRAAVEVGDLEARRLDDPVVGRRLRRRVPGRVADVPAGPGAVAEPGQQVHGQRGRGALALGAGDAGHPGRVGLRHEQAEAPADGHARRLELRHLGPVAADAGLLTTTSQRSSASRPPDPWRGPRARRARARRACRRPGPGRGPWTGAAGGWPVPRRRAPRRRRTRQRARTRRSAGA